jgi:hypothetical protein
MGPLSRRNVNDMNFGFGSDSVVVARYLEASGASGDHQFPDAAAAATNPPPPDRDLPGLALAGVPPDNVHHGVLAQAHVAGNEPIGKPVGMHAEHPLGFLV